mmetsp:Transcript_6473/g.12830  ORF Transcript_6473/g.12830 Transcript_6473/m.12830 type:complete len:226 (-) Transcript_6473:728-1405(-)
MVDVTNRRSVICDVLCEIRYSSRNVFHHCHKSNKSAVSRQPPVNDPAECCHVDVASAEGDGNSLVPKLLMKWTLRKDRRQTRGTPPLQHNVLVLNHSQNSQRDRLLAHRDEFVDEQSGDVECVGSDQRDVQSVCECRCGLDLRGASCINRRLHGGAELGFDSDDPSGGAEGLHGKGYAGNQTPPPYWDNDSVQTFHLIQNFDSHRSCPRDDGRVIVSVDVDLLCQ